MSPLKTLVLVTGANQGIGRATARQLAREPINYHVIIGSRDFKAGDKVAAELREEGCSACCVQLDLTHPESVEAAIDFINREFGYLDVLVNNAGVLLDMNESLEVWDLYRLTYTINVIGPSILTEGLLPLLQQSKNTPPRVVFVSCGMGCLSVALNPNWPYHDVETKAYDSSKAALNMMMLNFARIFKEGKVNAVCPGQSRTGLTGNFGHSAEVGAEQIVRMAILGKSGPTGTFTDRKGNLPW